VKITGMSAAEIDERIAFAEQLVAAGMRQTARAVTAEMAADNTLTLTLTAAGLPGSRVWTALQGVFSAWRVFVDSQIMPYLRQTWTDASDTVVAQVQAVWPDWEAPHRGGDLAYESLAHAENHMVGLSTELWENARAALTEGFEAGDGVEQLAARVSGAVDMTEFRARAAARTEVARASHAATFDMISAAGFTGRKEWLAVEDERTRKAHHDMDGKRVPIAAQFVFTDPPGTGMYPCDRRLPPALAINCRCDLAYDVDDEAIVAATATFRFDPGQPRDGDGKWTDGFPGGVDERGRLPDGSVPAQDEFGGDDVTDPARDKLGLAGRIQLGGGERLLSSGAVNADEGAFVMAVIDTPQGRRLRIGSVAREDKKAWTGDNQARDSEDEETGERVEVPTVGSTAELDESGIAALWDALERAAAGLPEVLKRYNADAREVRRREAAGGPQEDLNPEDDAYELFDDKISGTRWGDLEAHAYLAEGDYPDDDGPMKGRPAFYLNVQPRDGQPTDSDMLTPRGVQTMLRMLDTLVADSGELTASGGKGSAAWRAAYDLS